jgi:hypothetical protein
MTGYLGGGDYLCFSSASRDSILCCIDTTLANSCFDVASNLQRI